MYEGMGTIIGLDIINENWVEYLKFVKNRQDKEVERSKKRAEVLAGLEGDLMNYGNKSALVGAGEMSYDYPYYDISVNSFWNWYTSTKL